MVLGNKDHTLGNREMDICIRTKLKETTGSVDHCNYTRR